MFFVDEMEPCKKHSKWILFQLLCFSFSISNTSSQAQQPSNGKVHRPLNGF